LQVELIFFFQVESKSNKIESFKSNQVFFFQVESKHFSQLVFKNKIPFLNS